MKKFSLRKTYILFNILKIILLQYFNENIEEDNQIIKENESKINNFDKIGNKKITQNIKHINNSQINKEINDKNKIATKNNNHKSNNIKDNEIMASHENSNYGIKSQNILSKEETQKDKQNTDNSEAKENYDSPKDKITNNNERNNKDESNENIERLNINDVINEYPDYTIGNDKNFYYNVYIFLKNGIKNGERTWPDYIKNTKDKSELSLKKN